MIFLCLTSCCLTPTRVVYYFVQKEMKLLRSSQSTTNGLDAEVSEDAEEGVPLLERS